MEVRIVNYIPVSLRHSVRASRELCKIPEAEADFDPDNRIDRGNSHVTRTEWEVVMAARMGKSLSARHRKLSITNPTPAPTGLKR
jgi:hypothetical protein